MSNSFKNLYGQPQPNNNTLSPVIFYNNLNMSCTGDYPVSIFKLHFRLYIYIYIYIYIYNVSLFILKNIKNKISKN